MAVPVLVMISIAYLHPRFASSEAETDDAIDPGFAAANAVWLQLEAVAAGSGVTTAWSELHARLVDAHPHADASGALAWLFLFGVPDSNGNVDFPHGFPRDIDRAVDVARRGANLRKPTCSRCWSLLGLLLSVGYPPLVNVAHVTVDISGRSSLIFVGGAITAWPHASDSAARLPRDIGKPDPAATAYALAAQAGDAIGSLAASYLGRYGFADTEQCLSPGPNLASAITHRRGRAPENAAASEAPISWLGDLASTAIETGTGSALWDTPLKPLAAQNSMAHDRAKLRLIIANPEDATPADLVDAAEQLDSSSAEVRDLPRGNLSPRELRSVAAKKGDAGAALHVAVEHLQQNETDQAEPLLEQVKKTSTDPAQSEMAQYYLQRYTGAAPNASDAWPHLVKAAELGREDAELLVAHANAGGHIAGAPQNTTNVSKAMHHYRRIADKAAGSGQLSEMQAFAAYNLGVLTMQAADAEEAAPTDEQSGTAEGPASGTSEKPTNKQASSQTKAPAPQPRETPAGPPSASSADIAADDGNHSNGSKGISNASADMLANGSSVSQEIVGTIDAPRPPRAEDARHVFTDVILSRLPLVRMAIALGQRAARLGDSTGALLLSSLTSDMGHPVGHADAASLWDSWARRRPPHLGPHREEAYSAPSWGGALCNLTGWWSTGSMALAQQNVSRTFVTSIEGGGFEMFNASLDAGAGMFEGISASEIVIPSPVRTQLKHLHSFLWHTTYDVISDGAPVPVALQPPGAVPHLVEYHHQRGKLFADKTCSTVRIEAMHVNWTFHRLGPAPHQLAHDANSTECEGTCFAHTASTEGVSGTRDFLHCWIRPEWYFSELEANLASRRTSRSQPGTWEAILSLTTSDDCPCHGAFSCRRGDGACVTFSDAAVGLCPLGNRLCLEVPPDLEPPGKPAFAAHPEVCALAYHRRAAMAGATDAMHVLSHAYSNGLRGTPRDAAEAFAWSSRAMHAGDARGRFDVAYSLEFGLGVDADPQRAYVLYRELLRRQGHENVPAAAQVSSFLALLSASGRYLASRLLGGSRWLHAPWAETDVSAIFHSSN